MIQKLTFKEHYGKNLVDRFSCDKRLRGRVQVFDGLPNRTNKLIDTNNLIVYQGRTWLMQRAFNQNISGTTRDSKNSYISWFGLGNAGAAANVLIPIVPSLSDTELGHNIIINNKTGTDCIRNGELHPIDIITFEQDSSHNNEKLIAMATTTIGKDDANGPLGGSTISDYYDINEAGLYISDSKVQSDFTGPDASDHLNTIQLFARCTFSSIRKYIERQLVFVWWIYF